MEKPQAMTLHHESLEDLRRVMLERFPGATRVEIIFQAKDVIRINVERLTLDADATLFTEVYNLLANSEAVKG